MEITLERFESGAWKVIDPALVLDKDDRIRFKFKANFSGFLYVTNLSTSATNSLLFPRIDTGSNNRVLAIGSISSPRPKARSASMVPLDTMSWRG